MAGATTQVESLLRRERLIIGSGMLVICLLAWYYLMTGAGTGMSTLAMTTWTFPPPVPSHNAEYAWSGLYWFTMLMMWWIMMIAMMVPSAAPMILLFGRVYRHHQGQNNNSSTVPTASFLVGYLLAWLVFSVAATTLQWLLEKVGLMHTMLMWSTSATLSAWFLLAVGVYQLSPLKGVCLTHCRSPVDFLSKHWRAGQGGALRMGMDHGLYCVGCCWFLMALLFVGGIMNLVWIAGLAIFVLLEKLAPAGHMIARVSGIIIFGVGLYLLIST